MKRLIPILLLLLLVNTGCRKDKNGIPDTTNLYLHIGYGKMYSTFSVKPLFETEHISPAFQTLFWNVRENLRINYGGRQLESFEILFVSENSVTLRVYYRSDTGIANATYTLSFSTEAAGFLAFSDPVATNTNGTNLQPYIIELIEYLTVNTFKPGWMEDKLPGSKGTVAAFYRSDEPGDFFYGTIK